MPETGTKNDWSGLPAPRSPTSGSSPLGALANAYFVGFGGAVGGAFVGTTLGGAAGGIEGMYIGCVAGSILGIASCLLGGAMSQRVAGAIVVAACALTGSFMSGPAGGLLGGISGGAAVGAMGAGRLEFGATIKDTRVRRGLVWVLIGLIGGAFGWGLLSMMSSMEL
jgi:hypothetical protein